MIVYTLIAVIILHYRYCHLCFTGLGPIDKLHGAMRKRHARAANLATQRNVHWHGHCMHACTRVTIAPAYTKLANSSAARSVLPTTIHSRLTAISHTGRCLSGFILAIAVLAITSRLGIRVAAQNMSSTLQLALSLRVVARCGARRLANALMPSELSTRSNST